MKIKIYAIGKIKEKELLALQAEYLKRIPDWKIEIKEFKTEIKDINSKDFVIALDERGKNLSSPELAREFGKVTEQGRDICILIGGAEGHSDELRKNADLLISFGKLTWPHKLARIMLVEQIYRAWSILNNHPYHK
ncbi:MAG: hypothetical protein COV36_03730 [Alphaproteobacteria bacterium CG11_big_fil_rev_8_21_14_0_20_44_7]|nr:MAG: hypothetical protein COV36_03730 [Alphaproteobacteria bacterium CG11_big_fil_rev_8_21_14_0_20_44_7]